MSDTPQRIPSVPREEWTDAHREVFAFWGEPDSWENGSKTTIIMAMGNHPGLAQAYNIMGKQLLLDGLVSARAREIITLRVAWHLKSKYEWHYHVGYALNLDMTLDEITAIKDGPDAPNWTEIDSSVIRATDELMQTNEISDATWAALSRHYDRKQLMEIVFLVGQYNMTSWVVHAFGIPLESGVDAIGFDLKTASGKTPHAKNRPGESENWAEERGYSEKAE